MLLVLISNRALNSQLHVCHDKWKSFLYILQSRSFQQRNCQLTCVLNRLVANLSKVGTLPITFCEGCPKAGKSYELNNFVASCQGTESNWLEKVSNNVLLTECWNGVATQVCCNLATVVHIFHFNQRLLWHVTRFVSLAKFPVHISPGLFYQACISTFPLL